MKLAPHARFGTGGPRPLAAPPCPYAPCHATMFDFTTHLALCAGEGWGGAGGGAGGRAGDGRLPNFAKQPAGEMAVCQAKGRGPLVFGPVLGMTLREVRRVPGHVGILPQGSGSLRYGRRQEREDVGEGEADLVPSAQMLSSQGTT